MRSLVTVASWSAPSKGLPCEVTLISLRARWWPPASSFNLCLFRTTRSHGLMLTMPVKGIYVKVRIQVVSSPRQCGPRGCSPESLTEGCPRSLEGAAGVSISFCPPDGSPLAVFSQVNLDDSGNLPSARAATLEGTRLAFRSVAHFQRGAESCLFYPAKHW